jgi:hypothetical protein
MHIQSRALTTNTNVKQGPTSYRPEKTGVFHGLRFHSLISDFQSEDIETYLTTKPSILNYGPSGDMIFDMSRSKGVEREHNQLLRFFRDMSSGSTFTIGNGEYYDPYKDLDLTKDKNESNDLLNGQYTFSKFEKDKFLMFANKDIWTEQTVSKYLSKYFTKIPQYAKKTYQSIEVTGDSYHVIENNIGYPSESFSMFDFSEDDMIQIFNSSNNNQTFKVKRLVVDQVTGVERLYLDDATGITMEDMLGSAVILNKMTANTQYTAHQSYADPEIGSERVVFCSNLNIDIYSNNEAFGQKFYINTGRGSKKRGTAVVGKSNTYKFTFSKNSPAISFSITPDGVHNGGVKLTNIIKVLGENGRKNTSVELTINENSPRYIYYYNETYPNMGGRIHIVDECGGMSPDERRHVEIPQPTSSQSMPTPTTTRAVSSPPTSTTSTPSPPSAPSSGGSSY